MDGKRLPFGDANFNYPQIAIQRIETLLDGLRAGSEPDSLLGTYVLRFDGAGTSGSGCTGPLVTERILYEDADSVRVRRPRLGEAFLGRLALARPDLRPQLPARPRGAGLSRETTEQMPILIHGGIWVETPEMIGTCSDIDTIPGWKFLEVDLSPGHAFSHPLARPLSDDVWLHARVRRSFTAETPAGAIENAIEVAYVIDYGTSAATNDTGDVLGYYRLFDYGSVVYAPEVGPVSSRRRSFVQSHDPEGPGLAVLALLSVPTAVEETPFTGALSGRVEVSGLLRDVNGLEIGTREISDLDDIRVELAYRMDEWTTAGAFSFDALAPGTYAARLDYGGRAIVASPDVVVDGDSEVIEDPLELAPTGGLQAVPNGGPVGTFELRYALPATSFVDLQIWHVDGREMWSFAVPEQPPGSHSATWDATTSPPGVYVAVLITSEGLVSEILFKDE